MARNGIGGLIVLQRENDLDEFVHGQTLLDAEINEDMFLSIFNPHSPLHDGAVIIQGNRIRYATALLPVSRSQTLPKEWGTRHRAGLGITEVSDAECIIISEERREVLLASKGDIEKKKEEDLRESLSTFSPVSEERVKGKIWVKKIFDHLPMKISLFLLVCILWVFLIGIRQGETTFNLPVEYYSIPQNLKIAGDPPSEIQVRLKGSQRLLSSIKSKQVRLQIDLSNCHSGINQVPFSETNINTPSGIIVTHIYPRNIRIQLSSISKHSQKP
jgi:diadenylate cyclase